MSGVAEESRTSAMGRRDLGDAVEQLLEFQLDEGGTLCVEVADDEPGIERAARVDDLVVKARVSLESALDHIRAIANTTLGRLRDLAEPPQQIQVEFGIRL